MKSFHPLYTLLMASGFWLLLATCSPESIDPVYTQCAKIPHIATTHFYEMHYPFYTSPCFNPNNEDEFVYLKYSESLTQGEMRIHNLITGEDRSLYEGAVRSQPDWGVKNWILFSQYDNQIRKIHADGTGINLLTHEHINEDARWDAKGETFISWTTGNNGLAFIGIRDAEGQVIDTAFHPFSNGAWAPKEQVLAGFYESGGAGPLSIIRYRIGDPSYESVLLDKDEMLSAIAHFEEDGFIASVGEGGSGDQRLVVGNFRNKKVRSIQKGCQTNYVGTFSLSPSQKQLLLSRIAITGKRTLAGEVVSRNGWLDMHQSIWIMDVDGKNLRQVDLP